MLYFLQFKPDKSEAWRPYTEEQISKGDLPGPPTYKTVLAVDQDPSQVIENDLDPLEHVKYSGPMYLDFDTNKVVTTLDGVLDDVRVALDNLINKYDIPEQFIHCWLSGGKGVHITIPGAVFGVKGPTKLLPMIYKEVAFTVADVESLDRGVYSCGRGRMWRVEGLPRPGSGTFKVGTTPEELMGMTAEDYEVCVASARHPLATPAPEKNVSFAKAEKLLKEARVAATRKARAMKDVKTETLDHLREWDGIPGCVQKLITDGDCESSNWNQAAIQLATYIAVRYTKDQEAEYMAELVHPFTTNVESSGRPSVSERLKSTKEMISRSFRGDLKFGVGAFIATIGRPCNECPVCRQDLASGETDQEDAGPGTMDHAQKICWDKFGYHLVGETGRRTLAGFTFWPHTQLIDLVPHIQADGSETWRESPRQGMVGTLVDTDGNKYQDFEMPERAWDSRRSLTQAIRGHGNCTVLCGDVEVQKMLSSVLYFAQTEESKELPKMIRAAVCGVILERKGKATVPHYVESGGAYTPMGYSSFRFRGNPRQSPNLLEIDDPEPGDDELATVMEALCKVNTPIEMALAIGWFVAAHFREHIQFDEPQFPLLNLSGNAESGKTSLAILLAHLGGMDYNRSEFWNGETGTIFPLVEYVNSTSTVPRLIEEINPVNMGPQKYHQVMGILKAGWNKAPIQRGRIGADRELGVSDSRVSAPIVYTSEQTSPSPALRTRTVEVKLQSKTLHVQSYKDAYLTANRGRHSLFRMAKGLVNVSVGTSPRALQDIFHAKDALLNPSITSRPRWAYKTCLTGLHMLLHTMEHYEIGGQEAVKGLYDGLVEFLGGEVVDADRGKSSSEVDRVLTAMNEMADEPDTSPTRLIPGKHYWRMGNELNIVLQSCMPLYQRYSRGLGNTVVISEFGQMRSLLVGEIYFDRTEAHHYKPGTQVFVINTEKLAQKGTVLNNFQEGECEPE